MKTDTFHPISNEHVVLFLDDKLYQQSRMWIEGEPVPTVWMEAH